MTVTELIEYLKTFDPDLPVVVAGYQVRHDNDCLRFQVNLWIVIDHPATAESSRHPG